MVDTGYSHHQTYSLDMMTAPDRVQRSRQLLTSFAFAAQDSLGREAVFRVLEGATLAAEWAAGLDAVCMHACMYSMYSTCMYICISM